MLWAAKINRITASMFRALQSVEFMTKSAIQKLRRRVHGSCSVRQRHKSTEQDKRFLKWSLQNLRQWKITRIQLLPMRKIPCGQKTETAENSYPAPVWRFRRVSPVHFNVRDGGRRRGTVNRLGARPGLRHWRDRVPFVAVAICSTISAGGTPIRSERSLRRATSKRWYCRPEART